MTVAAEAGRRPVLVEIGPTDRAGHDRTPGSEGIRMSVTKTRSAMLLAAAVVGLVGCDSSTGPADLNGDGIVNAADLAQMLGAWGPCP